MEFPYETVEVGDRRFRVWTPNHHCRWRAQTVLTKEPDTIAWLDAIRPGELLLDIGANIGLYTLYAAKVRDARVIAFEPEALNFAALNMNLYLNHAGMTAQGFPFMATDTTEVGCLFVSEMVMGGSCHAANEPLDYALRQKKDWRHAQGSMSFRIDDLVAKGWEPPDHVKIDVDGFEHKVIEGMMATLRGGKVKSLIVETNHNLQEHADMMVRLRMLGFTTDATQIDRAKRKSGAFENVGEVVYRRAA